MAFEGNYFIDGVEYDLFEEVKKVEKKIEVKFTIEKMSHKISYYDYSLKKHVSYNAYAFTDTSGHCIMIACGEKNRDSIAEYLS